MCASNEAVKARLQSAPANAGLFLLTGLVRKCFSELLLSGNLCYKPEHA